jgi:protein TonB
MAVVKLNSLHVSFGFSILFHIVVIGVALMYGFGSRPPGLPRPEPVFTIELLAAPEIAVEPPRPVVASPTPPKVEPVKTIEPVAPLAKTEVPVPRKINPPAPVVPPVTPTPPMKVSGDASSPTSGLDLTTAPAQPLINARPDYLKNPDPPYPPSALRRRQEGQVLLAVTVSAQGRAERVTVKKTSGFPILDEAAQQAVRDWEFTPARVGKLAVASEIEVPVRFKLTN